MSSDNNSRFKKVQTMHRSLIFVKNNGHDTILKIYCNFKRQCSAAAVILAYQIFFQGLDEIKHPCL